MHSNNDKLDIMTHNEADKVIKELFESLLSSYQIGLEKLMKGSDFIFESLIQSLYCKCHKRNLYGTGSYVNYYWLSKNKKATINLVNDDDKCFQYASIITLNRKK